MNKRRWAPLVVRFWSRVLESDGCWEWTGAHAQGGYGQIYHNGKLRRATHVAWELLRGPIPEGLLCLHKCDNPPCVNPEHLEWGTQSKNMADCFKRGRLNPWNAGKKKCMRGHDFNAENTLLIKNGRRCRKCHTIYCRERGRKIAAWNKRVGEKANG